MKPYTIQLIRYPKIRYRKHETSHPKPTKKKIMKHYQIVQKKKKKNLGKFRNETYQNHKA